MQENWKSFSKRRKDLYLNELYSATTASFSAPNSPDVLSPKKFVLGHCELPDTKNCESVKIDVEINHPKNVKEDEVANTSNAANARNLEKLPGAVLSNELHACSANSNNNNNNNKNIQTEQTNNFFCFKTDCEKSTARKTQSMSGKDLPILESISSIGKCANSSAVFPQNSPIDCTAIPDVNQPLIGPVLLIESSFLNIESASSALLQHGNSPMAAPFAAIMPKEKK